MGAIANQLLQHAGDERRGFTVVQFDAARQATLREVAKLGDDELVKLLLSVSMLI